MIQKKSTIIKRGKKYCKLSELKVNIDETKLLFNKKITKILKVKIYNLLNYKKHKYRQKSVVEKWYILTNLSSTEKIKKIYSNPMSDLAQKSYCLLRNREKGIESR